MNKKTNGIITVSVLTLAAVAGFMFRQDIYDWSRLRNYNPPAEIAELADNTTLYNDSRNLFYVQHPLLADKDSFNDYCRDNEYTIVLGCYIHNRGIFLLDVNDERLDGIEEVTAAHELLHAAYERLSGNDKKRVDELVQAGYDVLTDTRILETIEQYRDKDASIVPNEMHSIIGTEVRIISDELEEYYSRYFTDRSQIVDYSERYEQAFIERKNQIRIYDEQLDAMREDITNLRTSLDTQSSELKSQRSSMNSLRNSGKTTLYNEQVPIYNAKVQEYNHQAKIVETKINAFNSLVQKRNAIAEEEAELVDAIDSRIAIPQQL